MAVGRSSAVGIAAHEAGHAIQDASHYPGLVVRNLIVPMASIGSMLFWVTVMAGIVLGLMKLVLLGIILFSLTVIFQVVNLPVEFDASRRGGQILQSTGLVGPDEDQVVGRGIERGGLDLRRGDPHQRHDQLLFYLFSPGLLGGAAAGLSEWHDSTPRKHRYGLTTPTVSSKIGDQVVELLSPTVHPGR